jgi:hypothetical protein
MDIDPDVTFFAEEPVGEGEGEEDDSDDAEDTNSEDEKIPRKGREQGVHAFFPAQIFGEKFITYGDQKYRYCGDSRFQRDSNTPSLKRI